MAGGPAKRRKPKGSQRDIRDATLRRFSGYNMKRAFNTVQTDVNRVLAPFGLRMVTFSALVIIVDNPGLRQSQLADALSVERPNLVLIVDDLERRGLISRNPSPKDRRAYALNPTDDGAKLYRAAVAAVGDHDAWITRHLSDAERATLIPVLQRIEAADRAEVPEETASGRPQTS